MEEQRLNTQILLELLLNQKINKDVEEELPEILKLYLRKLSCISVVYFNDGEIQNIIPKAIINNDNWNSSLASFLKKISDYKSESFKSELNNYTAYALPLHQNAHLILIRYSAFTDEMFYELERIVLQLGKDILHFEEQKRLKVLEFLFDQSSDAVQISKASGELFYINQVASKILGIPKNNANKHSILEFEKKFKNNINLWKKYINTVEEKRELIVESKNINQHNKKVIPVEITVTSAKIDDEKFIISNSRDITERKKQEKELKDTNQKLTSIFNEMSDVVYSFKLPELEVLFVTPSIKSIFGVDWDTTNKSLNELECIFLGKDKRIRDSIEKSLQENGNFSIKYEIETPEGEKKWVRNKGKYIYDQNNKPVRLDGVVMDRTKQYLAQENLDQELRLQNVLIDIASTYINLELSEVEQTIQKSLEKMAHFVGADRSYIFDYDLSQLTTSNTYEWCNEGVEPEIENLQDVPLSFISDWINAHKKGEAFYIPKVEDLPKDGPEGLRAILEPQGIKSLITIPLLDKNELIGFVGFDSVKKHHNYSKKEQDLLFLFGQMLINIRNRKQSERKLRLHEEKYRNIIANMKLGLVEVDLDDLIIYANQTFCNMSGYSLNELKGKNIKEIVPKTHYKNTIINISNERDKFYDSYEVEVQNKNSEKRWWFISGAPNYNDRGKLVGSIGIHLDITEQKLLEEELEKAKTFAEAGAKAKELFLANMSHEIRTPLNVIIGMIRQLNKEKLSNNQYFYVNQSESSAKHLLTIINNILDVAKIESGDMDIVTKEFSPSALAYNVHSIMYSQAKDKGLRFNIKVDSDIAEILIGDETRIRQVLINLVGNSMKFTNEGEINLIVDLINSENNKQEIEFRVEDTGIGMSKEFVKRVFEKFSQEQDATNRNYEGTGLGMTISNDLINLMESKLHVESEKNIGSKFYFKLNLEIGKKENLITRSVQIKQNSFKGKKALLVEDNEMNRFIAIQSLDYLGFETTEAENGLVAIEKVKSNKFDLILMDIQMPLMDGIECTKNIRNKLKIETPIIALTANAFKHDIESYLAIGMNDYITKPYDEPDFFRKIDHVIQLSKIENTKIDDFQTLGISKENNNKEKNTISQNGLISTLYDLSKIEQMSRGNENFINKMVAIFIDVASKNNDSMQQALSEKNLEKINSLAHKIKPSISQMGITSIENEVKILEKYKLEEGSETELLQLVEKTTSTLDKVINSLKNNFKNE